jgi:hypothetical protein
VVPMSAGAVLKAADEAGALEFAKLQVRQGS